MRGHAMTKKTRQTQRNNWVAKYARSVNKSAVHVDKKKALKRGNVKHVKQKIDYLAA